MNVSRETSLEAPLQLFVRSLKLDSASFVSGFSYSGVTRAALSLLIPAIYRTSKKPSLFCFNKTSDAEALYLDCFNLISNEVLFYSGLGTEGVGVQGFNLENERYRSEVVNALRKNKTGIIISSQDAVRERLIDVPKNTDGGFLIRINGKTDRKVLVDSLISWGYEQVDHTESPKCFSIRGGIFDVFLPYSAQPIRIEFFGDEIESIRIYNPRSQRTVKNVDFLEILPPPSVNDKNIDKLSLLDLFDGQIIYIRNHDGVFEVNFGDIKNTINLGCVTVDINGNAKRENHLPLQRAIQRSDPESRYLFVGNQRPNKTAEKYSLESIKQIRANISDCFYSSYINILCLSFPEINRQRPDYRSRWTVDSVATVPQKDFSSLDEINWGDYLVHQDFGIGLYRGLEQRETTGGVSQEFIKIEYADSASVYVPVEKFNRVHKLLVSGNSEPILSVLNSTRWERQKQTAKNTAKDAVRDLISLYTARSKKRGFTYAKSKELMKELELSFPYDETPGQLLAIKDIISDMEKEHPVDRLICGDVGFGKTEVALRAALKSIASGKKVLFLTPTTILADQHYISTAARLGPLGINIELLSRFKTKKQQLEILEKMMSGTADLVIGTHRLLSQDVIFPDLGLLIIDEEHRFGVKHKEKLRELRSTVDVLTLTATPIPRTLQQSLLGIRDISRINTPPKTRRPIKTFVQYFDWRNIKRVIDNELNRNGQVYFLHNDIDSIPFVFKKLRDFYPNSTIGVAHGSLNTKELENTVLTFFDGELDILICTTIIESGLDVANANTIIINNAQNFGLSQLYQIRGRVGRSHRQAYCHLLIPKTKIIGENARKRLKAIEQFTSLGSGYDISLKDLEIRGAGNLFGYKQSGHMAKVGFELYCKLLQEAVDETLGSSQKKQQPKISIPIDSYLDSGYIQLVQDRLYFYQQLSVATSTKEIDRISEELLDRFGKLPDPAKNLLNITNKRILLTGSSISSISVVGSSLKISLSDFRPYKSFEQMVNDISERLGVKELNYKFLQVKNGFNVAVTAATIKQAIKTIDIFVELFSN